MPKKPDYGRGHPKFLEYVRYIVKHKNYEGMPDVYLDNRSIQWEAPSNRTGGKFKDTHHKRREWWKKRAISIKIDPESPHWISKTAKQIHPTKKKPCKNCGRMMDIRYAYPSKILKSRILKLPYVDESFFSESFEHIKDIISRLIDTYVDSIYYDLPHLLKTSSISTPDLPHNKSAWICWIEKEYIPTEPSMLSPGAMSNAPDRLDGFHSFNLCCRGNVDPGRTKENLQSYATDRRVFEYWVDGDWIAADRLIGIIRSSKETKNIPCPNGHPPPCTADHIGPISLGFSHRPEFRLICKACNSAKNNRMTYEDVIHLIELENNGEKVASWYCNNLWNLRKKSVCNEETALRISKLLRDNRHTFMFLLSKIESAGYYTFMATLLGLKYADYEIDFKNFCVKDNITCFNSLIKRKRTTKYVIEQKVRRFRVAFSALREYQQKKNRNVFVIWSPFLERELRKLFIILGNSNERIRGFDHYLRSLIYSNDVSVERLGRYINLIPKTLNEPQEFKLAKIHLKEIMDHIAKTFNKLWNEERYVRNHQGGFDF